MKAALLMLLFAMPAWGQVQPVRICSPDYTCVTFDEQAVDPNYVVLSGVVSGLPLDSPMVSAPSGGVRLLIGSTVGSSFGNLFAGVTAKVEYPVARRLELDLTDTFSPVEQHLPYGDGTANQVSGGGIGWLTQSAGLNLQIEQSQYRVATLSKQATYLSTGVTIRRAIESMPMRFSFDYVRALANSITAGVESSKLQAGQFNLDMRVACHLAFCIRTQFDFKVGVVKEQGNPVCDGSLGNTGGPNNGPCPRQSASAGAFTGAVLVEWPRRRATESLAF